MTSLQRALLAAAAVWCALLFVGAVTLPAYTGATTRFDSQGREVETSTTATLFEINGPWVLVLLTVPVVAVALIALLLHLRPRHRVAGVAAWVVVGALGLFTLAAMLTIGSFIAPVTLALAIATALTPPQPSAMPTAPAAPPGQPA
jgi:cytochrome bd-type quinol oxidase subunit 2